MYVHVYIGLCHLIMFSLAIAVFVFYGWYLVHCYVCTRNAITGWTVETLIQVIPLNPHNKKNPYAQSKYSGYILFLTLGSVSLPRT